MSEEIIRVAQEAVAAAKAEAGVSELWIDESEDWSEASIPPRPWIAPGYLMRGTVTILSGPGGVSKSTLAAAWVRALATHTPFGRFEPVKHCKVLYLNAEDDINEQRMRLSAAARASGGPRRGVGGDMLRVGPMGVATLLTFDTKSNTLGTTQAHSDLVAMLDKHSPDVLILDPLVELHTAEENNNGALRQVVAHFRSLARQRNMACLLVHHAAKGGANQAGNQDSLRGASSIAGAARAIFTVLGMTAAEGADMGLPKEAVRDFLRIDGAKANYSRTAAVEWFERRSYTLDNGEEVAGLVPWRPGKRASADPGLIERLIAGIGAGSIDGPYTPHLGSSGRSVRNLFRDHGVTGNIAENAMLKALREHGVTTSSYRGADRHMTKGLRHHGLPAPGSMARFARYGARGAPAGEPYSTSSACSPHLPHCYYIAMRRKTRGL